MFQSKLGKVKTIHKQRISRLAIVKQFVGGVPLCKLGLKPLAVLSLPADKRVIDQPTDRLTDQPTDGHTLI